MFGIKRRRRKRLRAVPFPSEWHSILQSNIALYRRLPEADKSELRGHIRVFLAEKHFEGCGGLALTDQIGLIVAAQACLLLLHRQTDYFPKLRTVLVYPRAYLAPVSEPEADGIIAEGSESRLGESLELGAVVLSWEDVLADAKQLDGANLVLHEFAHQLDAEERGAEGVPLLESHELYATWARVLGDEYRRLRRDSAAGRWTVLDEYGASDPAEFFAVATESFFERPRLLRHRHRELYEELRRYYVQDPAQWEAMSRSADTK
jgi:Mlc titration factor MtfA (ptsG expression regulator)